MPKTCRVTKCGKSILVPSLDCPELCWGCAETARARIKAYKEVVAFLILLDNLDNLDGNPSKQN